MTPAPTPARAIPVLNYAPPIPPRPLVRVARHFVWTLCFILVGALLGHVIAPTTYTAVGFFNVDARRTESVYDRGIMQKSEIATILQWAPPVAAEAHYTANRPLTAADIAAHLRVSPVNEARLIEVAFDSDDRHVAYTVAQTIMSNYDAASPNVFIVAYPSVRADYHYIYPITGAILGLLGALMRPLLKRRPT